MMTLTLLFSPISHSQTQKAKDPEEEIGKLRSQAGQRHNIRENLQTLAKGRGGHGFHELPQQRERKREKRELPVSICVYGDTNTWDEESNQEKDDWLMEEEEEDEIKDVYKRSIRMKAGMKEWMNMCNCEWTPDRGIALRFLVTPWKQFLWSETLS